MCVYFQKPDIAMYSCVYNSNNTNMQVLASPSALASDASMSGDSMGNDVGGLDVHELDDLNEIVLQFGEDYQGVWPLPCERPRCRCNTSIYPDVSQLQRPHSLRYWFIGRKK